MSHDVELGLQALDSLLFPVRDCCQSAAQVFDIRCFTGTRMMSRTASLVHLPCTIRVSMLFLGACEAQVPCRTKTAANSHLAYGLQHLLHLSVDVGLDGNNLLSCTT